MRRQTVLGEGVLAGSGCTMRLDPLALPVRFTARDAAADGQVRQVEIDHARMRVRRRLRGMTISVNVPVTAFLGIALRRLPAGEDETVAIRLEHRDPALSTTLCEAAEDAVAEGRRWAEALGLPLLVDEGGRPTHLGALRVAAAVPRRRRRNAVKRRRSTMVLRRRFCPAQELPVVRGEREIIARS